MDGSSRIQDLLRDVSARRLRIHKQAKLELLSLADERACAANLYCLLSLESLFHAVFFRLCCLLVVCWSFGEIRRGRSFVGHNTTRVTCSRLVLQSKMCPRLCTTAAWRRPCSSWRNRRTTTATLASRFLFGSVTLVRRGRAGRAVVGGPIFAVASCYLCVVGTCVVRGGTTRRALVARPRFCREIGGSAGSWERNAQRKLRVACRFSAQMLTRLSLISSSLCLFMSACRACRTLLGPNCTPKGFFLPHDQ